MVTTLCTFFGRDTLIVWIMQFHPEYLAYSMLEEQIEPLGISRPDELILFELVESASRRLW